VVGHNIVGEIFPQFSFKLWNILRQFGRHIGPSGVMQNGIHEFG
jgi:hypothetical protein